jgi:adenylylsulfate kinase-like enzyme
MRGQLTPDCGCSEKDQRTRNKRCIHVAEQLKNKENVTLIA